MAADQKLLLTTQPEKPNHYNYLKEFRVEQCQSFLQHKCNQHRPFICFNWHFMNQRRRRPVRKRDGTFNYSADNYCVKYDETTGICPDGDDCPFLHRTAGDTERRYHLRYYKTCMCVHDTDSRGYCVKNGHHCAFAHGPHDQRPHVLDIKELESAQSVETNGCGGIGGGGGGGGNGGGGIGGGGGAGGGDMNSTPNALDKERNLMNEDPKWQDTNYVLANYKTDPCKRPPRLCRQGYACPQYHNSKDKRRSPRKFKYRSTPCPNVKHGEEWGEPANCEAGDNCQYCHTRTEQQFHPEIYKSTKCNDVQQAGYCPRSVFCAFAHVEQEVPPGLDGGPSNMGLGDLLSNVVLHDVKKDKCGPDGMMLQNGSGESCESASTSSVGSNNSHSKAPGSQLQQKNHIFQNNINNNCNQSSAGVVGGGASGSVNVSAAMAQFADFTPDLSKQLQAIENDPMMSPMEKDQRKRMCLTFSLQNIGAHEKFGNNLDELTRRDFSHMENSISAGLASSGLLQNSTQPVNIPNSQQLSNSISGLLQGTSAPVNIPDNNTLGNFSPSNHSNMYDPFSHLSGSAPKMNNSFGHTDNLFFQPHLISPGLGDALSLSPELRISELNSIRENERSNSLFENSLQHHQQQHQQQQQQHQQQQQQQQHQHNKQFAMSPSLINNPSLNEINRLRDELANQSAQKHHWEERILQATKACEAWKAEADESNRKAQLAEQQRDEALNHVQLITEKLEQMSLQNGSSLPRDLRLLSIQRLKALQDKLRTDVEEVEKVLYLETAKKCMKCEENARTVTLVPCNHYVLCNECAKTMRECPYCQTTIASQT